jgi:hypothetical protein
VLIDWYPREQEVLGQLVHKGAESVGLNCTQGSRKCWVNWYKREQKALGRLVPQGSRKCWIDWCPRE